MFERFTDRARRVVVLAQEEARLLGHNYIGTEHVLLGLIREGEGVGARVLESLGISLAAVRSEVESVIGRAAGEVPDGHIPFTPRAKKVLELSLREAMQLGHNYIGTEHILLGIIREGNGVAAEVLVKLGADLPRVRHQVMDVLQSYSGTQVIEPSDSPVVTQVIEPSDSPVVTQVIAPSNTPAVLRFQERAVLVRRGEPLRTDHLLAALFDDPDSLAAKVLTSFELTREAVEQRAAEIGVAGTTDELPSEK